VAVGFWLSLLPSLSDRSSLNIDICDSALRVLRDALVLDRVGELGDNIPGVQQTGNVTKHAQEDVDETVGAADSGPDPDCEWREEDGEKAKEDVCGAHGFEVECAV
jgi:hypothetical protein